MSRAIHTRCERKGTLPSKDVLRGRLTSISASSEIEGVVMDKETKAVFRRSIDECWSPQRRIAYLRRKYSTK